MPSTWARDLPCQVERFFGQASQVAAWRSHSAGIRYVMLPAPADALVAGAGINIGPPVAKKWPFFPGFPGERRIAVNDQALFFGARAGQDFSERARDKRTAPEPDPSFLFDAIGDRDKDAVRDGMHPLDRLPCLAIEIGR